jgi:hypothetical protein
VLEKQLVFQCTTLKVYIFSDMCARIEKGSSKGGTGWNTRNMRAFSMTWADAGDFLCSGKFAYSCSRHAKRVISDMRRSRRAKKKRMGGKPEVYRCAICGHFHIGSSRSKKR